MNKKLFMTFGICAIAACGLTACNAAVPSLQPQGFYEVLSELAAKEYNIVTLNIATTLNDMTLAGTYVMTGAEGGIHVEYAFEQMNSVVKTEDGTYIVPDTVKSTHTGVGVVSDGVFHLVSGEAIDISVASLNVRGFVFREECFENVSNTEGVFTANVVNPLRYLGIGYITKYTNMTTTIRYTESALTSITVQYLSAENAQIVLSYMFE